MKITWFAVVAFAAASFASAQQFSAADRSAAEQAMKQVRNGRLYLIPASEDTRGHGTTGTATFYTKQLAEFLQDLPAVAR